MRFLPFTFAALALAGCGAATTAPGSSGEEKTLRQPSTTVVEQSDLAPPAVYLISAGGKQRAAEGSSCISYTDPDTGQGVGRCGDAAGLVRPASMTVVQPGDNVIVTIPGATLKRESTITIHPLGCEDKQTETIDFPQSGELHWAVDLDHGAYQLDVFALFDADNGINGDLSASLGLLVGGGPKQYDYSGVVALDKILAVCPFEP